MVESLFSYRKSNSFLHKTNSGLKLFFLIIFSSFIFIKQSLFSPWILTSSCFLFALLLFICAKLPFKKIFDLKLIFLIGLFFTIFKSFDFDMNFKLGEFFSFSLTISIKDALEGLLWAFNFFTASLFALVFFDSTSMTDLQENFDKGQKKLARVFPFLNFFPLALFISLVISFIPEIFSLWDKIKKASLARQKGSQKKIKLIRRIAIFIQELSTLISLLLVRALEKRKALMNRS